MPNEPTSDSGINDTAEVKARTKRFQETSADVAQLLEQARTLLAQIESFRRWDRGIPKRLPITDSRQVAERLEGWKPELHDPDELANAVMEEIRYCCELLPVNPASREAALLKDYLSVPEGEDMEDCRAQAKTLNETLDKALKEFRDVRETTTGK